MSFIRAASALARLKGETYGLFGGRPLGMYTAVANLDQWHSMFGLDVEYAEQYDVVRYAAMVDDDRARVGLRWLEQHVGKIVYDGNVLTLEKLEMQVRSYHAIRTIMEERGSTLWGSSRTVTSPTGS
jgi:L-fucose isomerase